MTTKKHVRQAQKNYIAAKLLYDEALKIETKIQNLVILLYNYKVSPYKQHINYEDTNLIKDCSRSYLMTNSDLKHYIKECHKRFLNHKPNIKENTIYSYEENKLKRIAADSLLETVHNYMKDNFKDYDLDDETHKMACLSITKRSQLLELALKL